MIHRLQDAYHHTVARNPISRFIDSVLRGVGQVYLQNNPLTGLIFLIGIFLGGFENGLYALLGTVVATATALALGVSRDTVSSGSYGFNGTLTALALALYLRHTPIVPVYVIVAAICSTIVTAAINDALKARHIPMLTAPFVVTSWLFIAAIFSFGRLGGDVVLGHPHLTAAAALSTTTLTASDAVVGFFNGPAQVMLQQNVWTGVAMLIGLLVNSRISCVAAIVGSLIGIGVAWALGGPESVIRAGLFGYNSVLTAVALGGMYYLLSVRTALFTIFGAIVTAIVYGMLSVVLAPLGMPVLTAAFVITTWLCLLGKASLTRLQPIHSENATRPEDSLKAARSAANPARKE